MAVTHTQKRPITRTQTPATDRIYAAALAAIQNRPYLDPHELNCSRQISENCLGWLRNLYRTLDGHPDLQDYATRAGNQMKVLLDRLAEEERRNAGRAH